MTWLTWPFRILGFALWFGKEIAVSNVTVLRDNLTPGQAATPGIAGLTTRCESDVELTLLAALITLTPGTLSLGTAPRQDDAAARVLYVHGMYCADADALREELRRTESRMLRAVRRRGFTP